MKPISPPAAASSLPPRIDELESLRGLAALLVVLYHIPKWNDAFSVGWVNNGYLMVELFFVLSGFVIFSAYDGRLRSRQDLVRFQFLRFGRLYPIHLLFLVLWLGVEGLKYLAQVKLGISSPNNAAFQTNDGQAFIENLLLVQAILPDRPTTFNYAAWSISTEFYTYIVFGLSVLTLGRLRNAFFASLAGGAFALLALGETLGVANLLRCLAGFSTGCLAALGLRHARSLRMPTWASGIVAAALMAYLAMKPPTRWDVAIYPLTAALIATLVLAPDGWLNRVLRCSWLIWLGTASYSIYMSHTLIVWAANQAVRRVFYAQDQVNAAGLSVPSLTLPQALVAAAAVVVMVIAVSAFCYRWIEAPSRARSRQLAERWWPASA